jgi:hypothetical protein
VNDLSAVSPVSKASASLSALVPHGRKLRLSRPAREHLLAALASHRQAMGQMDEETRARSGFMLCAGPCPHCAETLEALERALR